MIHLLIFLILFPERSPLVWIYILYDLNQSLNKLFSCSRKAKYIFWNGF